MLGVLFNYSSCEKKKLHSFTYSAVRSCQLSHRKELYYFRPDFSVTKVEYYSSGANWIGLLPTQHPQYASLLIPPFQIMHLARFTLTSMSKQIQSQFQAQLTSLLAYTATSPSTSHLVMIFYSTTVLVRDTLVHTPHK